MARYKVPYIERVDEKSGSTIIDVPLQDKLGKDKVSRQHYDQNSGMVYFDCNSKDIESIFGEELDKVRKGLPKDMPKPGVERRIAPYKLQKVADLPPKDADFADDLKN